MRFKLINNKLSRKFKRDTLIIIFVLILFLVFLSITIHAEKVIVNPVAGWIPVLVEFRIPEKCAFSGDPGPPFVRVRSRFPSIPSAWETLKDTVKIRLRGSLWPEDEPVISGWRAWAGKKGDSGIEVKSSDRCPKGFFPVITIGRGEMVSVHWKIQIWGRYRFPEHPDLLPADEDYQNMIKQKIEVRDFSLTLYKVEGEVKLENIRNDALPEPLEIVGRWQGPGTLAEYEARSYQFPARADYVGELQLKMKLYFPEVDDRRETAYETPVEAYLRFMCGSKVKIRIIYDKLMRQTGG